MDGPGLCRARAAGSIPALGAARAFSGGCASSVPGNQWQERDPWSSVVPLVSMNDHS
jgi:hypothetical protein